MSPRARLTLLSLALIAAFGATIPAQAGGVRSDARDAILVAEDDQTPAEQPSPQPVPNGCPFRKGKLELIA